MSKKTLKTIIIKAPKAPKFDITLKNTKDHLKIITALQTLETNQGWQFLVQVFQANIDFLTKQIITKKDVDGSVLTDQQVDLLRDKLEFQQEIVSTPQKYLEKLIKEPSENLDLDPYEK